MGQIDLSRLQTESRNANTTAIDAVSTLEMCAMINKEDAGVADAVQKCLPTIAAAIDATAPRIRVGGRLVYVGAGTSGRLGVLDASEIQPTFSAPSWQFVGIIAGGDKAIRMAQEGAEDSIQNAVRDLEALNLDPAKDTLIGIAASGRTPYVLSCLDYAKMLGCVTLGVACCLPSAMLTSGHVDHMISVVSGPEVVTGSTRLKAGTATKLVLNMISTGIMIRIGKTYGNMMVELQSSNLKLKQRARNIIRTVDPTAVSLTDEQLDFAIKACNGNVKLALMHLMSGLNVEESVRRLHESGGVLKRALEAWKSEQDNHTPESSSNIGGSPATKTNLALCIDGGGSKCAIAVADESGKIGKADGGACNFTDSSVEVLKDVITRTAALAISDYLSNNGKDSSQTELTISAVLAGFSGFDRPGASKLIKPMLAATFSLPSDECVEVMADTDLLASVLTKYPSCRRGIVLIAGTGSVAMAFERDHDSGRFLRTGRSGGWGHMLGDEGSGYDIGRNGVRATLKAFERKRLLKDKADPLTPFHLAVMEKLGVSNPEGSESDLLSRTLQSESGDAYDLKSRLSSVAPVVLGHMSSDAEAARIASDAANHLVILVESLLIARGNENGALVLAGGVTKCQCFGELLLVMLKKMGLGFGTIEVVEEPACAAVTAMKSRRINRS